LHMTQLMPLPLTVSCFSKIQIGLSFLVPAHPGSPGKRAVKWVCVCVFVIIFGTLSFRMRAVSAVYVVQRARDAGLTIVTLACRSEYDDYEDAVGDEVFVSGPATSTSNNPFVVAVDDDLTPVSTVDVPRPCEMLKPDCMVSRPRLRCQFHCRVSVLNFGLCLGLKSSVSASEVRSR